MYMLDNDTAAIMPDYSFTPLPYSVRVVGDGHSCRWHPGWWLLGGMDLTCGPSLFELRALRSQNGVWHMEDTSIKALKRHPVHRKMHTIRHGRTHMHISQQALTEQ
jgi:hypothetical protein